MICVRSRRIQVHGGRWISILIAALSATAVFGDESADPVDYVQDVKPILSRRCYSCHGALKQKNDLRLDTAALAKQGGSSGPAIVPGKSDESLVIEAVTGAEGVKKMPPEGEPLTADQIAKLRAWIDAGAKAPVEKTPEDPTKHWSYQRPVRPPLPAVRNAAWVKNPIDAFIAAEHERRGLVASPPATKSVLLRRVYLDLIGLPPTRAEMQTFLTDDSDNAYDKVVDRLLESPHYGERWGRHWMDVWRYSDWDGFGAEVRESQPHIWRWRDWIIESLNADKPYDQMIVEMMAGDELAPEDPATVRATGFLARNWYKFNRNVWLDFTIEHTAKGFLGTTLNCARCHDHMYDPISQQDYYTFRAFFEAHDIRTDRMPGQPDVTKDGLARVYDANATAPTFLFTRGDEKQPDKEHPLAAALPAIFAGRELTIEAVSLSPAEFYPGSRAVLQEETLAQVRGEVDKSLAALKEAGVKLVSAKQKLADFAAGKTADPAASSSIVLADDFSVPRPELWTTGTGDWEYANGRLVQKDSRDAITQLLSVKVHPPDFVARFKFKTTGGKVYKSVGLSFDADQDRDFWAAYLSATGKLQVFQRVAGVDNYPAEGICDFPVELNREYELQVAVRGSLVNVAVDGKLLLVYKLPGERRKEGRFAVWTYDANAAEFLRVSVDELASGFAIFEKVGDAPAPVSETDLASAGKQAEASRLAAEKALATAGAALVWTQARIAADRANYSVPPADNAKELSLVAGSAEREHTLRLAEQNLLTAEQKLASARALPNSGDEKTKKAIADAETALTTAVKAHEGALDVLGQSNENYTRFGPVYPTSSTGRRLALARWIANPKNPLTARVAVNHIWLRHFGSPLVPSVCDFGLNGKPPTHPLLLYWLAVELMSPTTDGVNSEFASSPPLRKGGPGGGASSADGPNDTGSWQMKRIHRLIVTSNAYRQQSSVGAANESNRSLDPDNLSLWRMNVRRMEAEIIRDSTLAVAGQLDTKMAGPELDENSGMTVGRRSIYFRNSKEKKMTFLDLFDRPNVVECYRRSESVVPQQALAMANSPLSLAQARLLAKTLSAEVASELNADTQEKFVTTAFEQVLARPPNAAELQECEKFLADQAQRFADPKALTQFTTGTPSTVPAAADPHQRARENLVHVLLNHNDFLTVR